ncbi:hypothetical protein [Pseudoduganella buxea]|nr:hypothetical protein [Pseudoduganella buxea]MTV53465.1 hypothetical protein [Pseudoduganella buxea]
MNNFAASILALVILSVLTPGSAQDAPEPRQAEGKRQANVQADRQEKATEKPDATAACVKEENCEFHRKKPKYKGGPCQGGMCPPGKPEKPTHDPLVQPQQPRSR